MADTMRVTILGSLSVVREGGRTAAPSAPKERKLLALLLLNHGRVVPTHVLIDELWGDNPPRSVRTAVQTYILNIRGKLAHELDLPGAWVRDNLVVRDNEGYKFRTDQCEFDLRDYRELAELGENAIAGGNDELAVEALRKAEGLWSGSILPDVDHGLPLRSEIIRLEQGKLAIQELRIETELRLGRHRELLSELAVLALQHPFHERLHEYLMRALYHSGRSVQALEVFRQLRRSMVDEMGLEPSARIQELQQDILSSRVAEPALAGRSFSGMR